LRALPLSAARRCAHAAGVAPDAPIVLVAEMEAADLEDRARMTRLRSYERAGFRKVDPACAPYMQPDFRPIEQLANSAPRAVPLGLVVRRVGLEDERAIPAAELSAVVDAIYAMYAVHVPSMAVQPLREQARDWISRQPSFPLVPPTTSTQKT
jgi:hypothetical protein